MDNSVDLRRMLVQKRPIIASRIDPPAASYVLVKRPFAFA
jgi:hypothetical protein